jgi:GDPmannose 4,6-dehydratase
MTQRRLLISGISGQDGSYLAEAALLQGDEVHGISRDPDAARARLAAGAGMPAGLVDGIVLHRGDLADGEGLQTLVAAIRPDEIYHLGAQSLVATSYDQAALTMDCNVLGTQRMLAAVVAAGGGARFFHAASSEMFGRCESPQQSESTPFHPLSPYAISKLAAHELTAHHRDALGLFACNGILFNHDSPRRADAFVSKKIARGLVAIALGRQDVLALGNLGARRDWSHARDVVDAMFRILRAPTPDDYVVASGRQHAVRDLVDAAAAALGLELAWEGVGRDEVARVARADGYAFRTGQIVVRVDPAFFRVQDLPALRGDASKARRQLGWQPTVSFAALMREMVDYELALATASR